MITDEHLEDRPREPIDWDFDPVAPLDTLGIPICPLCDGPGYLLGQLGRLVHYRCRDCGIGFHTTEEDE